MPKKEEKSKKYENRSRPISEMRAEKDEEGKMTVSGYALVYDTPTELWPGYWETIIKGAATNALKKDERFYLNQHDKKTPLSREKIDTLRIKEDKKGVFIEADFIDNQFGQDKFEEVRSGLVDGQSFAFYVELDGEIWEKDWVAPNGKKVLLRKVIEYDEIIEFSMVTYPAYTDTTLKTQERELVLRNKPDFEAIEKGPEKKEENAKYILEKEQRDRELEIIKLNTAD